MFICEIFLFNRYFPQYCKSDMSKYGYLEGPFDFEITRVDCIWEGWYGCYEMSHRTSS